MDDEKIHAERRTPHEPRGVVDLGAAGHDLLEQARAMAAGRAARSLTPHLGADLKQTLLAICAGQALGEHPSPGPATLQVLQGTVVLGTGNEHVAISAGGWAVLPREPHDLAADDDAVVLLTVHAEAS